MILTTDQKIALIRGTNHRTGTTLSSRIEKALRPVLCDSLPPRISNDHVEDLVSTVAAQAVDELIRLL